ncbi:hypothetical protein KIPB_006818 [Kipferlia bialata]|uniref:Uncharacterized protein n=1 Tax=Kipferlia bialata TaxID=797122 RepID=A0A391NUP5_9EUKA|nr:hypothetical protein KIPB_006818 [Kipferlia bialata]|eukprot:g6818.t1
MDDDREPRDDVHEDSANDRPRRLHVAGVPRIVWPAEDGTLDTEQFRREQRRIQQSVFDRFVRGLAVHLGDDLGKAARKANGNRGFSSHLRVEAHGIRWGGDELDCIIVDQGFDVARNQTPHSLVPCPKMIMGDLKKVLRQMVEEASFERDRFPLHGRLDFKIEFELDAPDAWSVVDGWMCPVCSRTVMEETCVCGMEAPRGGSLERRARRPDEEALDTRESGYVAGEGMWNLDPNAEE